LNNNKTWELIPKSNNIKILTSCWVYKIKDQDDYYEFKNRFVTKDFIQLYGLDYIEIFIKIIKQLIWRLIFALIIINNWLIYKIDIVSAFT